MKNFTRNLFFSTALLLAAVSTPFAQDIHFSQFGNSPLNLSPGLNGVFGCDMRFAANYRNQWRSVRVPYNTFAASVENKFYTKKGAYDRYFSGALLLDYDRQGLLALTSYTIALQGSFTLPVNSTNFLTGGLHGGWNGRGFDSDKVTTDNQWYHEKYFNSGADLGENFDNRNVGFFDLGAGINWRWNNASRRSKIDFGVGVHHLNQPKENFWDDSNARLRRRAAFYAMGAFRLTNRLDLVPGASYQTQGSYRAFVPSALIRFYLNPNPYQPKAFGFGVAGRTDFRKADAIVPQIELLLGTWQFGFSYDLNISAFDKATSGRGGPEFSAIYRLCKVHPLPMFKTCPII